MNLGQTQNLRHSPKSKKLKNTHGNLRKASGNNEKNPLLVTTGMIFCLPGLESNTFIKIRNDPIYTLTEGDAYQGG